MAPKSRSKSNLGRATSQKKLPKTVGTLGHNEHGLYQMSHYGEWSHSQGTTVSLADKKQTDLIFLDEDR